MSEQFYNLITNTTLSEQLHNTITNTTMSEQFYNLITNTTLSEQFYNLIEKYNTVRTVLKSNRKIQYCQNSSKI